MQADPQYPATDLSQPGTPPSRSGPNRGLIFGLIGGVLVLALLGAAGFHYIGPTRTVKSFFDDYFVSLNASNAYHQLCSDTQTKVSVDDLQTAINLFKSTGSSVDTSGLTYSLVDESFFGDAHVRLGGKLTITVAGQKQSEPITGDNTLITLHSAGLGWCIATDLTTP